MNKIENTISLHILEQNTIFVFPTQTAADLWADRATLTSGVTAVATDRFIAWDDFKSSSIKTKNQNKKSIPQIMRSIFATMIIEKNAKEHFLNYIIISEYANIASNFTNWIAKLLPSLAQWKNYFEKANKEADEEDKDLLILYNKYKDFLDEYNLFEPAWETPPFNSDGKKYIVFYPEILMDYIEYENILSESKDIELIHFENKNTTPLTVNIFSNARTELRKATLAIKEVHIKDNIEWNDISVSVADIETYSPYIEREFALYNIPYTLQSGKSLTSSGAGSFFRNVNEVVKNDFAFDEIKALLLDNELPWKERELNIELIQFGKRNNCLCSYEYKNEKIDIWKKSFSNNSQNELLESYYELLKKHLTALVNAKTFSEINKFYFLFREKFFNMEECSEHSNNIISRCISELGTLIDLENQFPNCKISSPYSFFINYITDKMYVTQATNSGVHILPYRISAAAPFAFNVVLDASQSSLSIIYKQLSFLREDKRIALGFHNDTNVSDFFIRLYADNSISKKAYFSSSEKSFSGYSLSHSYFLENDLRKEYIEKDILLDSFIAEKSYFLNDSDFPKILMPIEKTSFNAWKSSNENISKTSSLQNNEEINSLVQKKLYEKNKIKISSSNLKKFYQCPRMFLFDKILKIREEDNEAELIDRYAIGNLQHTILQNYCNALKEQNLVLTAKDENTLKPEYEKILQDSINNSIEQFSISTLGKELLLTTKTAITQNIRKTIISFSNIFDSHTVYEIEKEYKYEIDNKNYICEGRIDCILQNEIGDFILVDFKSTNSGIPKNLYVSDDVDIPDFQMPMYLYLLENQTKKIDISESLFFAISSGEAYYVTGNKAKLENEEVILETKKRFLELLEDFANRISLSDFDICNEGQDFDSCSQCTYKAICRRTFTVSKREE